jgi:hypothetical protein
MTIRQPCETFRKILSVCQNLRDFLLNTGVDRTVVRPLSLFFQALSDLSKSNTCPFGAVVIESP